MSDPKRAFVLMAFEPEFDSIYADVVKPALEEVGYAVARADSLLHQQSILTDIIGGIVKADLVLVELTTLNPNVMYELGVSHGMGRPTVLMAQSIEDIPFDLRSYRILLYTTRFDEIGKLRQDLMDVGKRALEGSIRFGSPVSDFSLRAGTNLAAEAASDASCTVADTPEEEAGFLDLIAQSDELSASLGQVLTTIGAETETLGTRIEAHSAEIGRISSLPGPGTAGALCREAAATADDMRAYSGAVKAQLPGYDHSVNELIDILGAYGTWLERCADGDQVTQYRSTMQALLDSAGPALSQLKAFRDSVAALRGVSKTMNSGIRHMCDVLDRFIATTENLAAFCVRTLALFAGKAQSEEVVANSLDEGSE